MADGATPAQTNTVACCTGTALNMASCATVSYNDNGVDKNIPHKMLWGTPSTAIVATNTWVSAGMKIETA